MKNSTTTLYELEMMNEREVQSIDSRNLHFDSRLLSLFCMLHKDIWNWFSYEQLMHMNAKVFNYLSNDVLHMLEMKFKNMDSQKPEMSQIVIRIKDKELKIYSEPLIEKIRRSLEIKQEKLRKTKDIQLNLLKLQEYNSKSDEYLIPISIVTKALTILDTSTLNLVENKYIKKRDLLDYLESICNQTVRLEEIPKLDTVENIVYNYDMYGYKRKYNQLLESNARRGKYLSFYTGYKTYYLYDDIIEVILNNQ